MAREHDPYFQHVKRYRRVDIPPDHQKIITKGFSTVFYPTGYSEWPKKKVYKNLTNKSRDNPR